MIKLIACLAVLGALLPSDSVAEKLMLAHVAINPSQGISTWPRIPACWRSTVLPLT